ncbi:MAG: IS110 family transposase [Candidatus Eisenbacteria sp.]|nr:IS110 family transposase [Candidatus Eisenbacteria bacterium]
MKESTWVGLDVHAQSITAAILEGDREQPEVIKLSGDLMKVRRLFRRLSQRAPVRACYEASGAGFVLHRVLAAEGYHCEVIAPSLIPRRPGDHRKTDRLDAMNLARLYRSGHLTPVHVPSLEQEALRRLLRLRYTYQCGCTATKHRISGMLRSHGHVFAEGKTLWTKTHRRWLTRLREQLHGPLHTALAAELEHLEYLETQRTTFDFEIDRYAQAPPYRHHVDALCCLRGVKTLTAMILLAEIGDARRFRSPRALMAYFGLVPSERSSGDRDRRGPITKAGNGHVRRVLVEAAWNNRHRSGADLILKRRRQGQPPDVVAIALKAQHRLYKKFWRLDYRKHRHVAITAVARELCGFVWAVLNATPQTEQAAAMQ